MENYNKILDFWFEELSPSDWFKKNEELDMKIKDKFLEIYEKGKEKQLESWLEKPDSSLALIILLDQFPRNMFRDTKQMFQTDSLALEYSKDSIKKNFDKEIEKGKAFFYMPLMHSENLEDQKECLKIFEELSKEDNSYRENVKFAKMHLDIIERFGRFPHRNKTLNRESTKEEIEFLKQPNSSF